MSQTALAQQSSPSVETILTITSGPGRGTSFRMVAQRVRLGRGPDNDIVLADDPKCSRHHAEILWTPKGFEIHNVSERNTLRVNEQEIRSALLSDQSRFTIGETEFCLQLRMAAPLMPVQPRSGQLGRRDPSSSGSRPRSKKQSNWTFRVVALSIVGGIVWLGLSGGPANKASKSLTADERLEKEIEAAKSVQEKASPRRPSGVSKNDLGYNQAQEHFVKGFRDYKKGQYERALSSFQACLSLHPQHTLCSRYIGLTRRRFDELIQYNMVLGRQYRDQNQYAACRSAYRNVMVMDKDPTSKRYQEAKANYDACQSQLEDRF